MKKLLILLLFITHCSIAQDLPSWLNGSWKNLKSGAIEQWHLSGKQLEGMAFKIVDSDTVIMETLSIVSKDGILYYVADVPHNPAPTFFKISNVETHHFLAENPEHDFPKKIEYWLNEDHMKVRISAGEKGMEFNFVRIN